MKNAFWIFLLLLLLAPMLTYGQGKVGPGFEAQREVLYKVNGAQRLPAAVAWYTTFFGKKPTSVDSTSKYPFAIFDVDGIKVRLETDKKYITLSDPLFYWILPTAEDVLKKFVSLDSIPANRFDRHRFRKLRHFGNRTSDSLNDSANSDGSMVDNVQGFIIFDPEGNRVGVTNNPIYVPTH